MTTINSDPKGSTTTAEVDPIPRQRPSETQIIVPDTCPVPVAPVRARTVAPRRPAWSLRYLHRLVFVDVIVVAVTVAISLWLRLGERGASERVGGVDALTYAGFAGLLGLAWVFMLWISGAWDRRILGSGSTEYRRVVNASFLLFGAVALASYLARAEVARSYLATAVPLGLTLLIANRAVWRRWLRRHRRHGELMASVLVVGSRASATALATHLHDSPGAGYRVTGLCVLPGEMSADDVAAERFPVLGSICDIPEAIDRAGANMVAVTAADGFVPADVRRLSWDLEGTGIRLVVAPGVTDIAGARITVKPVAGVPLLQVEEPQFRGVKLLVKTAMDYVGAAALVTLLSPVLLVMAVLIKKSDPGPVFFRQVRVGRHGEEFRIWKFRSMTHGADKLFTAEKANSGQAASVFYKSAEDSRITPIGRFMRKTSIDELPQLFNVLAGQMSLIGPRPLVPGEGAEVARFLERRMLVRPGLTGLWQVSGRSDISVDERIRLDFYYVENWSVTGDIGILVKTVKAVVARDGAY